jgi:hypothetical protein
VHIAISTELRWWRECNSERYAEWATTRRPATFRPTTNVEKRCMCGVDSKAGLSGERELGLVDVMTLARKRDSRTFEGGCTSQHHFNNNGVQLRLHRLLEGIAKAIIFSFPSSYTRRPRKSLTDSFSPPAEQLAATHREVFPQPLQVYIMLRINCRKTARKELLPA